MGCVFWVHSSERGNALMAALIGAIIALCQVTGLIDAIHGFWPAAFLIADTISGQEPPYLLRLA